MRLVDGSLGHIVPAALAGAVVVLCGACGGAGSVTGPAPCVPAPAIRSSPPTDATVGRQYAYYVDASYLCGPRTLCNDVVGVDVPDGTSIDYFYHAVFWTPAADQADRDVTFAITTEPDVCGDVAAQTWTVHVGLPAAGAR